MKHLYTSRKMSRVFRGLVLALALVLVACGGGSDEPEPSATTASGQGQEALPTVPPVNSTPDSSVNEGEITVLEPETPATAEASTPDVTEEVEEAEVSQVDPEASAETTPVDTDADSEVATAEIAASGDEADENSATSVASGEDATAEPDESETVATAAVVEESPATAEATSDDSEAEPTERARTGNETFNHPGDGTGGSGMPGELDSGEEEDAPAATPEASPESSPVAQLEISGCEVPDVPGFLGDSNVFVLTADVNFRTGPGVDCDPVMDEPVGEGQIVLVLGGPVTQTDDDTEWVQIEVGDQPGWVTTEFLEPAE